MYGRSRGTLVGLLRNKVAIRTVPEIVFGGDWGKVGKIFLHGWGVLNMHLSGGWERLQFFIRAVAGFSGIKANGDLLILPFD